jgi:hypothetical protein
MLLSGLLFVKSACALTRPYAGSCSPSVVKLLYRPTRKIHTMCLGIREKIQTILVLLFVLPAVASAVDTTVTLTPDATIAPTNREVVTFGLPLAEGDVFSISEIRCALSRFSSMV